MSTLSASRLPAPSATRGLTAIGLVAGFLLLGVAVAAKPVYIAALVVVVAAAVIALQRPRLVAFVAVVALVLVPTYAAPNIGPLALHPAVLGSWLAAGALLLAGRAEAVRVRFTVVDGAVVLLAVLFFIPFLFGNRERGDLIGFFFELAGPYLAMRLLVARADPNWLPRAFAVATMVALPLVCVEIATSSNPFMSLNFNASEFNVWAEEQYRFGVLRAEGAFGQAISLSQFAATAMLLALGAAIAAKRSLRGWWLAVFAGGGLVMFLSYSRTGWVVLAAGVLLIAALVTKGINRVRLLWIVGAVVGTALVLLAVAGQFHIVSSLAGNDTEIANSSSYREVLLRRALRGEGLSWLGTPTSSLGAGIGEGSSIDNAYLGLAADWGYIGLIGILGVVGATFVAAWQRRGTVWALIPVVTLANFAGLTTVAINTQTQYWLWMLVGGTAGSLAALARHADPAQPAPRY